MVPYGSHKDLDGAWRHGIVIRETCDGREQKLYGKYRLRLLADALSAKSVRVSTKTTLPPFFADLDKLLIDATMQII